MSPSERSGVARRLAGPLIFATDAVLGVLAAPRCAACARLLEQPTRGAVCETCWSSIDILRPPLCRICGGMLESWRAFAPPYDTCPPCRPQTSQIASSRSVGRYEGSLRQIIHAFKYEGRRTLGRRLGTMMQDAGAAILSGAGCVIPVPLHPLRRLSRGFNQAADLAARLDRPVVHALWRTRLTAPQTGLDAARRRRNVDAAFTLSPLVGRHARRTLLTGHVVVLVDDVRTTGATLEACAAALRQAGAREVRALTAALASPRAVLS